MVTLAVDHYAVSRLLEDCDSNVFRQLYPFRYRWDKVGLRIIPVDMAKIALVHSNDEFSETLATLAETRSEHQIDNLSVVRPPRARAKELLRSQLSPEPYDLVQVDELLVNGPIGALGALARNIPLVVYFRGWADHDNVHERYGYLKSRRISGQTELLLRLAVSSVHISDATRRRLGRQYQLPPSETIHRPLDIEYYRSGDPILDQEGITLLTTTNLKYEDKYRGVVDVLSALEPIFADREDLQYYIAGGGEYLDRLREAVAAYKFRDRVTVLGFEEDVPGLLASADVFVYASYLDAYPTTVLEAQAAGLPVIANSSGGVPEVVGDAGIVVESDGLERAIRDVVLDESKREELAAQSRRKMAAYNETVVDEFLDLWNRILT